MFYFNQIKKNFKYFLLDHKITRFIVMEGATLVCCILSALVFGIGFRSFIAMPDVSMSTVDASAIQTIATGGMSGFSQCIIALLQIFGVSLDYNLLQSIVYLILNIPLLIFSFFKLGIKFSIFSTLNVIFVSTFVSVLPSSIFDLVSAQIVAEPLARAVFAGICTGMSSAIAFKAGHSAGGVDIIGSYYALRKSTGCGTFMAIMNACIVIVFSILNVVLHGVDPSKGVEYQKAFIIACFSVVYLFSSALVIDGINVRNKKVQLTIITKYDKLSNVIVANVPHSCTVVNAKGGYSGEDKYIIYATISSTEVTSLVEKIRQADPTSFINVTDLRQVYGSFFIKPLK